MLIRTMMSEVRRLLGYPQEAELPEDRVLMEIWQTTNYYRTLLRLTNEAWNIGRWDLIVPAGQTEALITPGDVGQIFLIQTVDPSNTLHIPRTVDIVKLEQMSMYWGGPDNLPIGGSWTYPHVAMAFAPFNEQGTWKISWLPEHQQSCTYRVCYTSGPSIVPPIVDDNSQIGLEEANFFLMADVALNLFGHIADSEKGLNEKQKILQATCEKKVAQWGPVFEAARWEGFRREQPMRRKVFGQSRASNIRSDYR